MKHIRAVGAIAPSSTYLARKMIEDIDFGTAKVIVELGAGTGSFTHEIIRRRSSETKVLIVENNPAFYRELQRKYGALQNVYITDASAVDLTLLLNQYKLPRNVDYIVSGLPFASLPGEVSHAILRAAKNHTKQGEFITFQYTLLKRSLLEQYFSSITMKREFRNLPPAYVLRARN